MLSSHVELARKLTALEKKYDAQGIVNLFARTQYQDKREALSPLSSLMQLGPWS
jgi:hypothetical protein